MCVFTSVCVCMCVCFWTSAPHWLCFFLLYTAHPCTGCRTPKLCCLSLENTGKWVRKTQTFCAAIFNKVFLYLCVRELASVNNCKLQCSVPTLPVLPTFCFPSLSSVWGYLPWPCSLHPPPSRQQMLGLHPDVLCLSLSSHIFNKLSYIKHLQRRLLCSAATTSGTRREKLILYSGWDIDKGLGRDAECERQKSNAT